jgi:hypothetical protein
MTLNFTEVQFHSKLQEIIHMLVATIEEYSFLHMESRMFDPPIVDNNDTKTTALL